MDTKAKMNQEKQKIMSELFEDISDKQCILDRILSEKSKDVHLSESSLSFYAQCQNELVEEQNKGEILFFRKYSYEKILNEYLHEKYQNNSLKLTIFDHDKSVKSGNMTMAELTNLLCKLRWVKEKRYDGIMYRANTAIGTYSLHRTDRLDGSNKDNKLLYKGKIVSGLEEINPHTIIKIIEETHPKRKKAREIICVSNPQNSKIDKTDIKKGKNEGGKEKNTVVKSKKNMEADKRGEHIRQQFNELNKQIYVGDVEKIAANFKVSPDEVLGIISKIERKCRSYDNGNCSRQGIGRICYPYRKQCLYYNDFSAKITEKSRQSNYNQIKPTVTKRMEKGTKDKQKNIAIKSQRKEKNRTIGLKDFLVRGNTFKCTHKKHIIENVEAMINIDIDGKVEQTRISAGYCEQCKVYFILDSTYQNLKKKGIILCRITDEKVYMKGGSVNGTQLAQESILMQYGYNVSQTEGLTATRRQKILAVMIDNKILSKSEIISYLDFFISQRSSMPNMGIAISKWEDDREFVENYRVGHYSKFGVNAIHRK